MPWASQRMVAATVGQTGAGIGERSLYDAEYAPPVSFRGEIALVIAVSLSANTLLCALAFALGRGLALWWS